MNVLAIETSDPAYMHMQPLLADTNVFGEPVKQHPDFGILKKFVDRGTDLIRQHSFVAALSHFVDPLFAAALGWQLDAPSLTVSPHLSLYQINLIAHLSEFDHTRFVPTIKIVTLFPNNNQVPRKILHNTALIHAEEWLHGLRYFNGQQPVAGFDDLESDVASYLLTRGVELTDEFLDRYNRRADLEAVINAAA